MRGIGAKLFWGKYVLKMTTHGASLSLATSVTEKTEFWGRDSAGRDEHLSPRAAADAAGVTEDCAFSEQLIQRAFERILTKGRGSVI